MKYYITKDLTRMRMTRMRMLRMSPPCLIKG